MKKMLTAIVLGMVLLVGSYNTTEAAEHVNGYEVTIAEDGCRIYTTESFKKFAVDHQGENIKDQIFLNTMRHIRHMAIRG